MKKTGLLVCLFVGFAVSAFALGGQAPQGLPETGRPAIDFKLPDLSGRTISLSGHKGKVIFLNFFATWCPPCREEMPSMQALYNKLKGRDFEMLAVSIDRDAAKLKAFVEKNKYTFRILSDPDGTVASQYGVGAIPATFIIDKKGRIAGSFVGGRDWTERSVLEMLTRLMKEER
ncbi:hypothetical protein A2625_04785 [candidate division WOR-1 bacterium RIFCSPHIGHO2_01_FULL_53_15]|uniref:Thioredoxin domain-containing protein n=1 Tax=candidate division WOR-1 bacterium RIFCSPHIGHO2_01_FULL_53_15 TaxID=1802564 RepID=A0A1F4Q2K8_UNCSA|nr:MAG: hypothetical protein A2625_04785 [candidate division WOR-1 bacterium RIFCSPHIGHO2_01_FULL_53_15]OGC13196.1 MAG: hypothetical protein A3D23_01040 [candidate division WOR-1 bacterium RIFCSPHIGHO2_02_FULL_53_26]